ncbi:gliding motility lipoprotein GldH [Chryseosolibacter indicus]|uniref:Gliding motility lipoprotein GldH n=1 Tax=Chryseosolibacter indicus TaxID=2782351 RepID=A0ABS5VKJ0_9BACT|nr:gliding motility lipoprotein GldH [Chryseosolibacter indicus]MBT1701964.1 gliding motility lipoprotein GldH [Chryseosolibacter indicus]
MRTILITLFTVTLLASCDKNRVYDKNEDFDNGLWPTAVKPSFEFEIKENVPYNIYGNIRNSVSYPFSRLFITYYLEDSTGNVLNKKLIEHTLFDPKTGKPEGTSGLGDIYDHRVPMINNYQFPYTGKYRLRLEQFMRTDSLQGILAAGVRIEKVLNEK